MHLHTLSSGSHGNCYLLTDSNGHTLIIDLGIKFQDVQRALSYDLQRVVGAVVTHRHGDHATAVEKAAQAGIIIHTNLDVINAQREYIRPLLIKTNVRQWTMIGGDFEVLPLQVVHDVPCEAFVVRHPEMGKLLFCTDSVTLPYKLNGLNHIMIEANYSDKMLEQAITEGTTHAAMRPRLLASHMELATTIQALKAQDLSQVEEIILLHLSSGHADPEFFKDRVQAATAIPTYVATDGLQLEISTSPNITANGDQRKD